MQSIGRSIAQISALVHKQFIYLDSLISRSHRWKNYTREIEIPSTNQNTKSYIEEEVSSLIGDKGYDQNSVYKAVLRDNKEADIIIDPRANAVVSEKRKWTQRDKL